MEFIAKKIHKDRTEILNFCDQHKRIHLFGAGFVGSLMLRYLADEEIAVCDVLVSPGNATTELFHGIPLKELREDILLDGDGVIIAVDIKFRKEIFDMLLKAGLMKKDIYIQTIYNLLNNDLLMESNRLSNLGYNNGFFSKYTKLDQLGIKNNTDKSSNYHNYLNKYEFFLKDLRNETIKILELGVYNGGSLKTWADYFFNAEIFGVDINEKCKEYENERCHIIIQDLGDEKLLEQLSVISPSVIIDDASHYTSHQIKALYHLMPILKSGGVFIIEDLGTNFNSYRNVGYQDTSVSCYEFCRTISDIVTSGEFLDLEKMPSVCVPLKRECEFLASQIEMISFIHESCIMIKK